MLFSHLPQALSNGKDDMLYEDIIANIITVNIMKALLMSNTWVPRRGDWYQVLLKTTRKRNRDKPFMIYIGNNERNDRVVKV